MEQSLPVAVERDAPAAMRDGIVLRADIYRPQEQGQFPVLLCRTPYGKSDALFPGYVATATRLAAHGYIAVVQDTRGRYSSDGDWEWLHTERAQRLESEDGYDSVEWAALLESSDGRVGMWGNSYDGYTALRAAGERPPSLQALFVSGIAPTLQDENRGIFRQIYLEWLFNMAVDLRRRNGSALEQMTEGDAAKAWSDSQGKWMWWLPLDEIPEYVFAGAAEPFRDYLTRVHKDVWALDTIASDIQVPVCHLTGWWDCDLLGTIKHFQGLRASGREDLRASHRLVVGPWAHSTLLNYHRSPTAYEDQPLTDYATEIARWYGEQFKPTDDVLPRQDPTRIFVLNENAWRHDSNWPPAGAAHLDLFLHGPHAALSTEPPGPEDPDVYSYDPRDPVTDDWNWEALGAPVGPGLERPDVLSYSMEPLAKDMLLLGDVACVLWASSDAPDTDFTARLVELRPGGEAVAISSGIIRARYREGYEQEVLLVPGQPTEFAIEMTPVGVLLAAGSRLRLDISSSDFPNFDRNHNTGRPFWSDRELVVARQTVYHDPEHPSRVTVPVATDDE